MTWEKSSFDDKYLVADQGDENLVVYLKNGMRPVWDRWSYEAGQPPAVSNPPDIPSIPPILSSNPVKLIEGVNPIGMSYWRNINYHGGRKSFMITLAINDQLRVLTIDKDSLRVVDDKSLGIHHTGEGIYFSVTRHDILYVPLDNSLIAVNVFTGDRITIWESNEYKLWQIHSNYNENVHSATLKNNDYQIIGWGVFNGYKTWKFPLKNEPDECQIDKSGEWLLVKEKEPLGGDKWNEYNRIIHVASGEEKIVNDPEGAVGHSDNGFGCTIGENNYSGLAGALDMIDFPSLRKMNMYSTGIWNMGYVSFTNARPGPIAEQFCLVTTPNELIKVRLDGSGGGIKVCPNLTESQEYEHRPKANLCPLGEYAVWTTFVGGSLNAYVVRVS